MEQYLILADSALWEYVTSFKWYEWLGALAVFAIWFTIQHL